MVEIKIEYQGDLRCLARHGPSGKTIITDAPVDNHGKGESFSPTDLAATALGTCMATIMGIYAQRHAIDLKGMVIHVEKHMVENPRRIGKLILDFQVPVEVDDAQKKALESSALTCPVHKSLDPKIDIQIHFHYPE